MRFKDAQDALDTMYSPAQQAANRKVQEADGFLGTAKAMLENPSTIATGIGESIPQMLGGAGAARGAMALAPKLGPVLAGALGEGLVGAGSAAEQVRGQTQDGLLTGKQAALAGASGLATAGLGALGGKVAQRMGVGDVDTMLAGGTTRAAGQGSTRSTARQVLEGAVAEGALEEMPQSMAEQALQNVALDKPIGEGVGAAAAQGLITGTAMGGAGGGIGASGNRTQQRAQEHAYAQATQSAEEATASAEALTEEARQPPTMDTIAGEPINPVDRGAPATFEDLVTPQPKPEVDPYTAWDQEAAASAPQAEAPAPVRPSEAMGIDPTAGPLSKAAATAVDSGTSQHLQDAQFIGATGRDLQVRATGPGVTDDSNVIDVQGRVVDELAVGASRGINGGAQRALPPPKNLREGLERIRAQRQEAANAQAAAQSAPTSALAVSTARPGAVEAAGPAPVSTTTGVTDGPQADQAQQTAPQQPQAPAAPGLTNAATTQNDGAQGTPAPGAQGAAPTAQGPVARPDGWRKSMLRAVPVAKSLGIDHKGKRLTQVVAEIDARDTRPPAAPIPAPTPTPDPVRIGRDQTPLAEGGKPFKTRKAAADAKKLQPMMRVVPVDGGYALAEKTPAQLAAEAKAARRLAQPRTGTAGAPLAAHEFIAAEGGLNAIAASDLGIDGNPRIGNRRLFAGRGRGLSMEQATQKLIADGYLGEGATLNDAYALIKTSLSRPQYNADGYERIAQAESDAQFDDYMAAQEEMAQDDDGFDGPFGLPPELTAEDLAAEGYTAANPALQAEVNALVAQSEAAGIDTYDVLEDIARNYADATQDQYNAAAREALAAAITRSNQDGGRPTAATAPAAPRSEQEQGLNQPVALEKQAQAATESVAPEALELAAQTPAEAAARQAEQEQADKAEAAAKRAEEAAAKAEEERKRIAQASVRAADSFDLGQDPLDSLTGQGGLMFSRTGAQSSNAQQPTSRAWYDRFVSLLPASYRNDPHRREPLPAEDWNVQRAREVRSKVEALNKQLRGADDRKGYGPVSVDGLGNLQVDARDVSAADLTGGIMALANELGAGIAATNVRSADARALQNSGFVPESSLAAIADRLMQRPFASPTNNYAKDSAPGTVMTYKPRGFPAALFARDVVQNNATPARPTDSNARNVATQMLVDGLTEKWTRAPEIIVARNMQDPQVPQAVRDYDETLKSQGATGEARGFIYKGKVYLLSDELKGPQQIAEVLFHEVLGHYGLRGAFGNSLDTILQQIGTMRRRDVVAKAREYGLFDKDALGGMDKKTASVAQIWAAMSSKDRLSAAEEVLAEMAQTQPNISFVQRAIAAIRNWLRSNVPGFKSLRLTDADIIQAYILPARGFVTRSKETGAQSLERAMMAFSRDTNEAVEPHVSAARQILESINKDPTAEYALRVIPGEYEGPIKAGDVLPVSKVWLDGEETSKSLKGTSVARIRGTGEKAVLDALTNLGAAGKNGPNGYYFGNRIVLVKGEGIGAGEDVGESIFKNAEVIGVWNKSTKGLSSIQPNESTAPDSGGAAFSRTATDQTQTEAFRKWFGDSKVVDADGKPLRVLHGTGGDFSVFSRDRAGATTGAANAGMGFFFTDNAEVAGNYARMSREPQSIMPVYLSLQNPLRMEAKNMMEADRLLQAGLKDNNDGAIITVAMRDGGTQTVYMIRESNQVKSATGNNGSFDPANPDIRFSRASTATGTQSAWDAPVQTGFDDVIYKLQDKNIDLKRVVESITKSAGQVADSVNAYLKEELFHKRAAKRVEDFGARELKPLMNQMRLMGFGMEDVEEYLHARHAKEANAVIAKRNPGEPGLQDGGSGMTDQAADNYFAKLDPAQRRKLEAVAKNVDAIIDKTRKLYVSYGLENQDVVDGWTSMYQHYIPLMREDKDGGMGTGQGFSVKGKETKGRTGSTRKVVDILANIASQREKLIVRGEKNIVAQALVGLAQANPNPDFWEVRSQAPTERVFDPKTGVVVDRPDPLFKSRENVAVAKVKDANGKVTEQMVVFNEDNPRAVRMAAAMKNLDAGNLEGLLGMSAKITRYFSAINTQYNPVFGVVNLVRDVQGAMVNLAATPLAGQQGKIARDTASALRGIYSDIRKTRKGGQASSKWAQLWEQMQEDGGTTGYRELFTTSADRANNLKSILNPEGWMDNKWGKFFTADGRLKVPMSVAQKGATEIFGWLSDYNEAMENGVRLAAYKAALDMGMSREQAASLAKNLTVNFNRKGQVGMQAGAVYAFFNAAMQGTARIGQTLFDMDGGDISTLRLSKTGKAVVYGGVTLGVMQALALAGAGFDEEDPPEFVRERSLIIPTGGKTYVSIPMPLGLHVIPGIGRHATEFALSGFDKPAKRALSVIGMFADAFNPIGNAGLSMQTLAPTALDPLVALTENKDWTGKPIARVSFNKAIPGHTQWKDTATWYSKMAAEAINWVSGGNEYVAGALSPTPDQIDYLIAQVGGGVAREASKVFQAASTTVNGEELPTYKIPLLGRFAGNAASQASQGTAFYANLDRLNALETEIKGLRKDGRFGEAAQLARENPQAIMIPMANRAERDVQKLRREKRELIAIGANREEVRAKEAQITAVMARLNEAAARRKATAPE